MHVPNLFKLLDQNLKCAWEFQYIKDVAVMISILQLTTQNYTGDLTPISHILPTILLELLLNSIQYLEVGRLTLEFTFGVPHMDVWHVPEAGCMCLKQ